VQAVQQERCQRFPHADVFHRDELQPAPQMLSDISGGRQHLVGGEHGVVDVAAADFLLQNRNQLIHRDTTR